MPKTHPARILRLLFSESDRYKGKPLYQAVVDKCREMKIAGATVFRGMEGYGGTAEIHKAHVVHQDRPIAINIVDSAENLAALVPAIEEMMDTGLSAVSDVQIIRVQKTVPAQEGSGD